MVLLNTSRQEVLAAVDFLLGPERLQARLVQRPISTLQVRFKLGYVKACYLAEDLETIGFWRITCDRFGQRAEELTEGFQRDAWK